MYFGSWIQEFGLHLLEIVRQAWGSGEEWRESKLIGKIQKEWENIVSKSVLRFSVQQETALHWRVTDTGAITTRCGEHSLVYLM